MRDSKINLIRWIIIFIILQLFHFANAQSSTEPPESPYGLYTGFDPSMVIIIIVLICAFFFVGFFSLYFRQCAELPAAALPASLNQSQQHGLNPAVINTFPIFVYSAVKDVKIGKGALECAICLSEFEDDDTLRLIKCDHVFHPDCIDAWLFNHVTCPVCRANQLRTRDNKIELSTESNQVENEIVINVNEEDSEQQQQQQQQQQQNRARITGGKFPRSHSTGHSTERYTLRLPDEIMKQMIANVKLKRTMSFNVVLPKEGSSRGGRSDRSDRWVFSMTPPFVTKAGSVDKCGDVSNNNRTLLTAVKSPLNCLSVMIGQVEESSARPPV